MEETPENKMRVILTLIRKYERLKLAVDTKTVYIAGDLTFTIKDTSEISTLLGEIKTEIGQRLVDLLADFKE